VQPPAASGNYVAPEACMVREHDGLGCSYQEGQKGRWEMDQAAPQPPWQAIVRAASAAWLSGTKP
jgi:hypothetical protein